MALGTIEKPELPGVIFQYSTDSMEVCMDQELVDFVELEEGYNLSTEIDNWIQQNSPIC
jgi:hypothetical protein